MGLFGLGKKKVSTTQAKMEQKAMRPSVKALCTNDSLNRAYAVNGTVYCVSNHGSDFEIGFYELSEDHTFCKCFCLSDRREIGTIAPDGAAFSITMNRMEIYHRVQTMGLYSGGMPSPIFKEFARVYKYTIDDTTTHETIAEIDGDPVEAAAAFLVLVYEVLDDSSYSKFYKPGQW
ncbi:MAG: hypothetical protein J5633_08420 [Oscillospiraceae bacterium]|nr:hypothetical protein [Oscillospiraceae bacterium]